jgi:hypothetical protein
VNAFDAQDGRHHVQHLADILADPVQLAFAAGASQPCRLDGDVHPRQMRRQSADIARRQKVFCPQAWQFGFIDKEKE